ncbi:hypothetical protein GCM10023094_56620 [Rhodococcus olei]|uniref:Periplasmic binding protein domain-containing protein n=1 Tax=Rhodococcus olei TaxID=2161675 RepID=A0ABP8PT09_9NOCA
MVVLSACGTAGGGTDASGSAEVVDVDAAKAQVAADMKDPSGMGNQLLPLKAKPSSDTKVVWLACDIEPTCTNHGKGLEEAAAAAGVGFTRIAYQMSSVESLLAAFDHAMDLHPDAILLSAMPKAAYASKLPQLEAAGIPVVTAYTASTDVGGGVSATVANQQTATAQFKALANWTIADSGATAKALVLNLPDFDYYQPGIKLLKDTLASACRDCTPSVLDVATTDLAAGAVPGKVISALQADPSINYVLCVTGGASTGLSAALKAAGLDGKVTVGGQSATPAVLQEIKSGDLFKAWTSTGTAQAAWAQMDQALRAIERSEVLPTGPELPIQLLTVSNIEDVQTQYGTDPNFRATFEKLWNP